MTTSILPTPLTLAPIQPSLGKQTAGSEAVARGTPTAMNADTIRTLTDAVADRMLAGTGAGEGRTGPAPVAELRPSTIPVREAGERLAGIVRKLPQMLAALTASQDPIRGEEGAAARASEGAVTQATDRNARESATAASAPAPATGLDADIGERSANAGAWITSSPFSHLLAMLRHLLLKFEKMDRDNSTEMVVMQREITILAGNKGIEKAREGLGGAIGAAVMTGAIGGAALKQTFKSTSMQVKSAEKNVMGGNKLDSAVKTSSGGAKGNTTPASEMRPARELDGKPAQIGQRGDRPSAAVEADAGADTSMKHVARAQAGDPGVDDLRSDSPEVNARAQIPASNAMMLNMLAPSIGGTVSAGVNIEAEMTEAERQLALQVADVFRRIADEQQDQSVKTRDMRDAAAQLFESLLNLVSSTSAHIIGKY